MIQCFPSFSQSPLYGGSLTLYSSLSMILALHLLIIQATTWVLIASDILSSPLWVKIANAALFRGLLHINAARKSAIEHSMRWQQLSLRYFLASSTFVMHAPIIGVSWKVTSSDRICIRSVLRLSDETLLIRPHFPTFLFACYLWDSELNTLTTVYSSSDQSTFSVKAQGPIYDFRPNIWF